MISVKRVSLTLLVLVLVAGYVSAYPLDGEISESDRPIPANQVPPEEFEKVQIESDEVHEPVYIKEESKLDVPREVDPVPVLVPVSVSEEVPESSFTLYDQDGDGYIDIFEWERKIEDELAKKKFLDADANDDDKISQEEYQVWSSPAEPQENVNEVFAPSDIVVQPVDISEGQAPVGRSAEERGEDQGGELVLVGDVSSSEPDQEQPEILVEERPPQELPTGQDDDGKVIAIIDEASQPTIVLLEDEKLSPAPSDVIQPEVAQPEASVPRLKSIEEAKVAQPVKNEQAQPQSEDVVKVDLGVPVAIQSEVVKPDNRKKPEVAPVLEKKREVESQPEEIKLEEVKPQPEILPAEESKPVKLPEIQPKTENLPQLESQPEKLPEAESQPEKLPEAESQPEKLPEVQSQPEKESQPESEKDSQPEKRSEVESQPEKLPEVESQPEKLPELESQPEKLPEVESQPEKQPELQSQPEKQPELESQPEKLPEPESQPEIKPEVSSLQPEITSEDNLKKEETSQSEAIGGGQSEAKEPANTIGS